MYLYFHRCSNHHGLLEEVVVERRWVVIEVQDRHKNLSQAVLPLCVFCLHVKVILGPHLCIKTRPWLGVDDPWCRLDQKSVNVGVNYDILFTFTLNLIQSPTFPYSLEHFKLIMIIVYKPLHIFFLWTWWECTISWFSALIGHQMWSDFHKSQYQQMQYL